MTQRRMRSSRVLAHPPCGDWSLARPWRQGHGHGGHRDHLEGPERWTITDSPTRRRSSGIRHQPAGSATRVSRSSATRTPSGTPSTGRPRVPGSTSRRSSGPSSPTGWPASGSRPAGARSGGLGAADRPRGGGRQRLARGVSPATLHRRLHDGVRPPGRARRHRGGSGPVHGCRAIPVAGGRCCAVVSPPAGAAGTHPRERAGGHQRHGEGDPRRLGIADPDQIRHRRRHLSRASRLWATTP